MQQKMVILRTFDYIFKSNLQTVYNDFSLLSEANIWG